MKSAILLLAACCLVPSWAAAEPPSASRAAACPASADLELAGLFTPAPAPRAGCSETLFCAPPGPIVTCTSHAGSCSAGSNYVECDGVKQYCVACSETFDCCGDGSIVLECQGFTSCSRGGRSITCDGSTQHCPTFGQCPQ